jgi:hypothetical protein
MSCGCGKSEKSSGWMSVESRYRSPARGSVCSPVRSPGMSNNSRNGRSPPRNSQPVRSPIRRPVQRPIYSGSVKSPVRRPVGRSPSYAGRACSPNKSRGYNGSPPRQQTEYKDVVKLHQYTPEEKAQFPKQKYDSEYTREGYFRVGSPLTDHQRRYCRCVLHVAAGKQTKNPYSICAASVKTSYRGCLYEFDFDGIPDVELLSIAELEGIPIPKPFNRQKTIELLKKFVLDKKAV